MQLIVAELKALSSSGLDVEEISLRYRELMLQQEQLRQQAEAEIVRR
jgi:DNA primase